MLLTPAEIKPKSFESRRTLFSFFFFFLPRGGCTSCLHACLGFYNHISTRTFRRALTTSLDSCAEIKSAPSVHSLEEGAGKRCSECVATLPLLLPVSDSSLVLSSFKVKERVLQRFACSSLSCCHITEVLWYQSKGKNITTVHLL